MRIHIVQKGDTLWKIAQKYGVNFEQLKSMNTHIANPDAIMPGMKIKIPTTAGYVKKEMPVKEMPVKKEKPIAEHPFAQEKPQALPVEEEMPVPEQPKEIMKEVPKPIYMPKPPQTIIPAIDINNYYMLNMAKMQVEQPQPIQQPITVPTPPTLPPMKEMPVLEEEKEEPIAPEMEEVQEEVAPAPQPQPQPFVYMQPVYPCIPVTPLMPGTGMPCHSFVPVMQPAGYHSTCQGHYFMPMGTGYQLPMPMMQQPYDPALQQGIYGQPGISG